MDPQMEMKLDHLIRMKSMIELQERTKLEIDVKELKRLKEILGKLGYLNVYLNIYLKNLKKKDNLKNIQQYINQNLDVWLRGGHRI